MSAGFRQISYCGLSSALATNNGLAGSPRKKNNWTCLTPMTGRTAFTIDGWMPFYANMCGSISRKPRGERRPVCVSAGSNPADISGWQCRTPIFRIRTINDWPGSAAQACTITRRRIIKHAMVTNRFLMSLPAQGLMLICSNTATIRDDFIIINGPWMKG